MAKLLVQETAGVREFEIVDAEVHIGRELDNALRLADPSISRHHAVIRKTSEGYEVHDNQSSNGVLVNGNRVSSLLLKDGDRVTLGQIQITFSDPKPAGSPLGTVRMSAEEMAKVQVGAQTNPLGVPAGVPPAPTPAPEVPVPAVPAAPMPPPPPVPPAAAPAPLAPPPVAPPPAPYAAPAAPTGAPGANPAPAFLQSFLPPIPDDAQPTGERGDFVTRLLAHLIDAAPLVVLMIAFQILSFVMALTGILILVTCLMPLLMLATSFGYMAFLAWCWMKFGATPGKKIMKLRVVPENNHLGRIDMGTAVLRLVGHICNFGIGYLLILGEERKGLQDIISKSIVIKVDR